MIRLMEVNDISQVIKLEKILFSPGWSENHFKAELTENIFSNLYVLEIEKEIVGYVGFWILFETAQITTLAVAPHYQKQGYGKQLLQYAIQKIKAADCESITLEVRVSNQAAQKLYTDCGFSELGIRKNYYGNEDAILMGVGI